MSDPAVTIPCPSCGTPTLQIKLREQGQLTRTYLCCGLCSWCDDLDDDDR